MEIQDFEAILSEQLLTNKAFVDDKTISLFKHKDYFHTSGLSRSDTTIRRNVQEVVDRVTRNHRRRVGSSSLPLRFSESDVLSVLKRVHCRKPPWCY